MKMLPLLVLLFLAGCCSTPAPNPAPSENNKPVIVHPGDTNAWPRRGWDNP